jgi:BirA family transcriptional regulator, biotin operon repressor / biotin---[acetyl-CoA-carboxylase] ligase
VIGTPRHHFRSTGSTNTKARELAQTGAPHGTLVTASEQTAGRGRYGRTWVTPAGGAIAASLVLRRFDELLPLRAGLAVADLAGADARVKWPNDVLLGERKLAGILAEARAPEWAVLGIGVNVTGVPPEVADIAAALGRDDVEPALQELLRALGVRLEQAPPELLADLRERDALLGRRLRWAGGEGVGAGIDDAGALLVARADGTTAALSSGEILLAG